LRKHICNEFSGMERAIREHVGILTYDLRKFFKDGEEADILSSITAIWRFLEEHYSSLAPGWFAHVQSVLAEEHASYTVGDKGAVRYLHDEEFARSAGATISLLDKPRYANARDLFGQGHASFHETPPDGKGAIRSSFFAAENIFRIMFPDEPRLTASPFEKRVRPLIENRYAGNKAALGAASKQISSFMDWIDAAHFYRHEPGTEEPAQPPLELAIELVSVGASLIRWLVALDQYSLSRSG
jgi:hypothetical protein